VTVLKEEASEEKGITTMEKKAITAPLLLQETKKHLAISSE